MSTHGHDGSGDIAVSGYASITPQGQTQRRCERPSCGKLLPQGVELYVLHDKKGTSAGFGVCPDCKIYYENKGSGIEQRSKKILVDRTSVRPQQGIPPANPQNIEAVFKANSRAKQGDLTHPVQNMGAYGSMGLPPASGSMGPPLLPYYLPDQFGYQLPNPNPNVPNVKLPMASNALFAAGHRGALPTSSLSPLNVYSGYTTNHANYLETRRQKQTLAYAPGSDHRITVEFRGVLRKPGAAAKQIGELYMVKDQIPVSIGGKDLKQLAWDCLYPKWCIHTNTFPLRIEQCAIYNKDWVEIVPALPDVDVISRRFYTANTKTPSVPKFKTGKFRVDLCIPWRVHRDWEHHQAAAEAAESSEEEHVDVVDRTEAPQPKPQSIQPSRSQAPSVPSAKSKHQTRKTRALASAQNSNLTPLNAPSQDAENEFGDVGAGFANHHGEDEAS
ncbi:hypothetical protein B0H19DRAFT_1272016 [Mycena capillaripes]|nr:hypothetical protein B0H19DRAFT_1272016 [Mycena capillaripes]